MKQLIEIDTDEQVVVPAEVAERIAKLSACSLSHFSGAFAMSEHLIDQINIMAEEIAAAPQPEQAAQAGYTAADMASQGAQGFRDGVASARKQPAQPVATCEHVTVRRDVVLWLLGESGKFECPPEQFFRGKPAPYFWRKALREATTGLTPSEAGGE